MLDQRGQLLRAAVGFAGCSTLFDEMDSRSKLAGAGLITGSQLVRDPETGKFVEGHQGMGGRPEGSKDSFPRNSYRAMKEMIAGRILKIMKDEEGLAVPSTYPSYRPHAARRRYS